MDPDLMEELESILSDRSSTSAWDDLIGLLDDQPQILEFDGISERIAASLEAWPDRIRAAPRAVWNEIREGGELPPWWGFVRHIELQAGERLEPLAALGHITSLDMGYTSLELDEVDNLRHLTRLKALDFRLHHNIELGVLRPLVNLERLSLSSVEALEDVSFLASMRHLRFLDISDTWVGDVTPLTELVGLSSLDVSACHEIVDIAPLRSLTELTTLRLNHCGSVTDLSPLAALAALTELDLLGCDRVDDLSPLATLAGIETLLIGGSALAELSSLQYLTRLRSITIGDSPRVEMLPPSAAWMQLQNLSVIGCKNLRSLASLSALPTLRHFRLNSAYAISDFSPLARLTNTRSLQLEVLPQLRDVSFLNAWDMLETAHFLSCDNLSDLSGFEGARRLQRLSIVGCSTTDLRPLASLPVLAALHLSFFPALTDLSPLNDIPSLRELRLNRMSPGADLSVLHLLRARGCRIDIEHQG